MIFKNFKDKSNKNYINSQLKRRSILESNSKIKRLGVVFNNEEVINSPNFTGLAEILNVNKNAIYILGFKDRVVEDETIFSSTFSSKDLGWSGMVKNKSLKQFLNTEFDALISYYKEDVTALKFATAVSKAKFKIGILETDERLNDLIIKTEVDNFDVFSSELKKYLNILNKI